MPRFARVALLVFALVGLRADEGGGGDTSIPPLTPGLLAPMWPRMRASLPVGFAALQGGVAGEDARVEGSALVAGLSHPDPAWSWGAGAFYAQRGIDAGEAFPDTIASARIFAGVWWRLTLNDHLLMVVAPGASWAEGTDEVGFSVPVAGVWLHQQGTTTWMLGFVAIADHEGLFPLPVVGALLSLEDWRLALTPLLVSAERLIGADGGLGVQAGFTGASAPLATVDGQRRTLSVWDLRLGLRGRWSFGRLETSVEVGWVAVGRASVGEGYGDPEAEVHHLRAAPYGGVGVSRSW